MATRRTVKQQEREPRLPRGGGTASGEERRNALYEIGVSGLQRTSGFVYEEFLRDLQGPQGTRIFREMTDNDPIVGAVLFAVEQVIMSSTHTWEPANDSDPAQRVAYFFRDAETDMSHTFSSMMSEVLTFLPHGWSYLETVYKLRQGPDQKDPKLRSRFSDGLFGWRKIGLRAQETLVRWEFDEEGGIQGMHQQAPPDYSPRFIPIDKSLLFRTKTNKNNPEGRSILRNAYRPWYFKRRIEEIEAIGIERDLAGLPMMTPPADLDPDSDDGKKQLEVAKQIIRNVRRDEQEGVLKPSGWEFSLLNSGGRRQIDTDATLNRYDRRIAMVILAQFIMLGMEKVGSFSLSVTHEDLFLLAVMGWLVTVADVFNRHEVPRLGRLNGIPDDLLPRLHFAEVREPKVTELGTFLKDMGAAGFIEPDERIEQYLRSLAKLPPKIVEEAIKKAREEAERNGQDDADVPSLFPLLRSRR